MDRLPLKFLPEEHQLLRVLRASGIRRKKLLVAVSGGRDSVLCLLLLHRLQPLLKNQISVAYVHHGAGSGRQWRYRNRAQKFVHKLSEKWGYPFFTNPADKKTRLTSEQECREFRYDHLRRWGQDSILVLAHHADDQLETQLLNLIRGSGVAGVGGMAFFSEQKLRPLLNFPRATVLQLARQLKLRWVEDPSNVNTDPFRNWMRQKWLPALEKKRPGSLLRIKNSLEIIRQNLPSSEAPMIDAEGIQRQHWLGLSLAEQRALIVMYLRQLRIHDYSQGQIEEICRRLDNRRENFKFTLLKHEWRVGRDRVLAVKR